MNMPTRYVNNWLTRLNAVLPAGGASLPVPQEALGRLDLSSDGQYVLTLVNSLNPLEQSAVEVVRITATGLVRAQEGTDAIEWPVNTYVYAGVTAGILSLFGGVGPAGDSAYEVWLGLGNTGSEQDFIDSLKGGRGDDGSNGDDGRGIASMAMDGNQHLIITYTDGSTQDAGLLPGGAPVGSAVPRPLGEAGAGDSGNASREDHVHPMPTPADIGAATAAQGSLAESAVQLEELADALSGKVDKVAGYGLISDDEKTRLSGVATGATANQADTYLLDRTHHTGSQAASTISDLSEAVQDMLSTFLVQGTGITLTYNDAANTLTIAATGSGSAGLVIIDEASTARTAAAADAGKLTRFSNASASTFTIPPQSSVAWNAGDQLHVRRAAAASLTLTPGSGVTLNAPSGGTLVMTNNMTVTLVRTNTANVWDVMGQTVAA